MCFSCARRFPYVHSWCKSDITWTTPLIRGATTGVGQTESRCTTTFCGLSQEATQRIFGLDTYMAKYGAQGASHPNLRAPETTEELQHWSLDVPFGSQTLAILCCPEDRRCSLPGCTEQRLVCTRCELPLCRECKPFIDSKAPSMPPFALGNDMMVFYAPRELYTMNVTVLEMICASVCITSMICFTLEMKCRSQQSRGSSVHPYDWSVHMARHRMGGPRQCHFVSSALGSFATHVAERRRDHTLTYITVGRC